MEGGSGPCPCRRRTGNHGTRCGLYYYLACRPGLTPRLRWHGVTLVASLSRFCRMCFGHEVVAKLEHLPVPLVARIVLEGRSSCLFQTTEQPVAQMKVPIDTARGHGAARLASAAGAWQPCGGSPVLWMACDSQLHLSPLTRAHIPRKRGDRAPQPRKRRPTARWSSRDRNPTSPAPCFSYSPCSANLAERQ